MCSFAVDSPILRATLPRNGVEGIARILAEQSPCDRPFTAGTLTGQRCTIYIMRRTQLYLDDNLWNALHASARSRKTSISELVREAVRERYLGNRDERMKAMQE